MKNKLFFVLALCIIVSRSQAQRLTTKVVSANISEKSIPQLLSTSEQLAGKELFLNLVADGRWNILKNHFRNAEDFQNLLLQISYKPEESRAVDNPSMYAHLKPFTLKSSSENKIVLQNSRDKSTLQINYTLTLLPKDFIIENITLQSNTSSFRSSAGKPTDTVPTFARLASFSQIYKRITIKIY